MRVAIIGAGAQAKEALEIFRFDPEIEIAGLVDLSDKGSSRPETMLGQPVLGGLGELGELPRHDVEAAIVCCASNRQKAELHDELAGLGLKQVNAIHPRAIIAATAEIEQDGGIILNAGVIVQPYARIARGVVIHVNTSVDHDSVIEEFVNIAPTVCVGAWCTVKREAFIYIGASIVSSFEVGRRAVVGAGAVVLDHVPDDATVAGVPARILSTG